MARHKSSPNKYWNFTYKKRHIHVLLDKILIFRFFRLLRDRFWGLETIIVLVGGFGVCFLIRPDLLKISTAFSDFGTDVRTAPYFAGSVFFAAYGLWRWRNYLSRTLKRPRPILGLVSLTIIGFYLVALMPISWEGWPHSLHLFGATLTGVSIVATVLADSLLVRTRKTLHAFRWRVVRGFSFLLTVSGGWLTYGSVDIVGWYRVSLLGEAMVLLGYAFWIITKTFSGEGSRTVLSRTLRKIVLVD